MIVNKYDVNKHQHEKKHAKARSVFRLGNPMQKLNPFATGLPLLCREAKEKFSITTDDWQS
jgi:hypothetical protein